MSSYRAPQDISSLLPKLSEDDPDIRFMALEDLRKIFEQASPAHLHNDYPLCGKVVSGLLATLNDVHGEVQNSALRVLGPFVTTAPPIVLCPLIDQICALPKEGRLDSSIPALALRSVTISLPRPIPGVQSNKLILEACNAVSRVLVPRLVGYYVLPSGDRNLPPIQASLLKYEIEHGTDNNTMDVLVEVARCFGPALHRDEINALLDLSNVVLLRDSTSAVLKKKAVTAICALTPYMTDDSLSAFVSRTIEELKGPRLTSIKRKMLITLLGSVARAIPSRFGVYLSVLAPLVLSIVSEGELTAALESEDAIEQKSEADDSREAALVALDNFCVACAAYVHPFADEIVAAGVRWLKYDPNVAMDEDMDEDMDDDLEDALDGDDFEAEQGFDEEDDTSWKVRRCAAKLLSTTIEARSPDLVQDAILYDILGPALVARFREREDSVRLEILTALSSLIQRAARDPGDYIERARRSSSTGSMVPPFSRKRRRGESDASVFDGEPAISQAWSPTAAVETPPNGAPSGLALLTADIVPGAIQLLKTSTVPTKQATIVLLKCLVIARKRSITDYIDQLINPLVEAIKAGSSGGSGGSSSAVTPNTVRLHALQLLGAMGGAQPSGTLVPHLDKIVPVLAEAANTRHGKASVEAFRTIENLILASTAKNVTSKQVQTALALFYDRSISRISASDADAEVRQQAIQVLGLLLARTSGRQELLSADKRNTGLDVLAKHLDNEVLRISAIKAIDVVAELASKPSDLRAEWIQSISLNLASYLRKTSRALRAASLAALKKMAVNPTCRDLLSDDTIGTLVELILPALTTEDVHLLAPALTILCTFVQRSPSTVTTPALNAAICRVVEMNVTGAPQAALLHLVQAMGEKGVGKPLMTTLLQDIGVTGSAEIIGRVVGCLLVAGGDSVGVKLADFELELQTTNHGKRKCLCLAILGETALLKAANSSIATETFTTHFTSEMEHVPLTAAVSLGRAGVGNVAAYLPVILQAMQSKTVPEYLLLHSVKEMLQHDEAEDEIRPFAQDLWRDLLVLSKAEDNKAISAECLGRLAIIEPKKFLPQLQSFLRDNEPKTRGIVISALRYTLGDTDSAYDEHLQPAVIEMLKTMLKDEDLENRRLALTTFNAVVHNKAQLLLPSLTELLPLVMNDTVIKPELIREVSMGPFKIKVDDGLEVRKSAYDALFSLQETALARVGANQLIDRIADGIADEHDIRILCMLMLTKLLVVAPDDVLRRLRDLTPHMRTILATKLKDNAVKQEIERAAEASRGTLRLTVLLNRAVASSEFGSGTRSRTSGATGPGEESSLSAWSSYMEWTRKEFGKQLKAAEGDLKEKER